MRIDRFVAACVAGLLSCLFADADAAAQDTPQPRIGPSTELVFTPIEPCRLFNTRLVGGRIPARRTRTFQVVGSSGFQAQGGRSDGCGIPTWATAVSMTLTAVDGDRGGYLTAYATDTPRPDVFSVIHEATVAAAGNPVVRIFLGKMTVYSQSYANVLGDLTGYYAPRIRATINKDGTIMSRTSRIIQATKPNTGVYYVDVDRNLDECAVVAVARLPSYALSAYTQNNRIIFFVKPLNIDENPATDIGFNFVAQC